MPLFNYVCINCDHPEERIVKLSDVDNPIKCSKCGSESKRELYAPGRFVFNGKPFSASSAKNKG